MKRLTPHRLALLSVLAGALLAVTGVALLSIPIALILAGVALAALGLEELLRGKP